MFAVIGNSIANDFRFSVIRFCIFAVVLTCFTMGQANAIEITEILNAQTDALELDELYQSVKGFVPEIDLSASLDLNKELKGILEIGRGAFDGVLKGALRSGILLLIIVLFGSLTNSFIDCLGQKAQFAMPIVSAFAITTVAITDVNTLIGLGTEVIVQMEQFSKVLLPTVAAVTAASGSPGAAAARQMAAMLFSDVLMTLINRLLLPLVYTYIAACTASAAIGNKGLNRIAATLKWIITMILTSVLLVFVGYLSVSGVIAKTTDAVALKATKFTMSTVVPVVGGILSDAAETVLAGASILKNTVGIFGMLAVLGICFLPFIQLGIHYLVYKFTAALCATVSDSNSSGLIDGIGGAFGIVLGMTGACAVLLMVSLISAVSMVNI